MTSRDDLCAMLAAGTAIRHAERQLDRFASAEGAIRAFAASDLAAARAALAAPSDGSLGGVLFAAKDIFASERFPTAYGAAAAPSPGAGARDAFVVAQAQALGAVLLGKAACTPLGVPRAPETTNPHDVTRTPGGSSSGSAAAVAAGFVSFAFGSQTAGSTIRPAAFCGVTGYKPSFGLIPVEGMAPLAPTLDHVGLVTASPRDAWYVTSALLGAAEVVTPALPRRVALLTLPSAAGLDPAYQPLLEALTDRLAAAGIAVDSVPLPVAWPAFARLNQRICYWEAARLLAGSTALAEARPLYEPEASASIASYLEARRALEAERRAFEVFAADYDAVLMPSALGPAPLRHEGTGDAVLNRFWTALHVPVVTIPLWRHPSGLPLGLQLIGRLGTDRALLAHAEALLGAG